MFTLGSKKFATASADGGHCLQLRLIDGQLRTAELNDVRSVGFVQVGDDMTVVYEGWWVLVLEHAAIAVHLDCVPINALLRAPPLRTLLDRIPHKALAFVAKRPACLDVRGGVASLSVEAALQLLCSGSYREVASVDDFPLIL